MPNPNGTPVELGGQRRVIRFDFHALYQIEMQTPECTAAMHAAMLARLSARSLAVLTWAGLLHENRALTIGDVVAMEGVEITNSELVKALTREVAKNYSEGKAPAAVEG